MLLLTYFTTPFSSSLFILLYYNVHLSNGQTMVNHLLWGFSSLAYCMCLCMLLWTNENKASNKRTTDSKQATKQHMNKATKQQNSNTNNYKYINVKPGDKLLLQSVLNTAVGQLIVVVVCVTVKLVTSMSVHLFSPFPSFPASISYTLPILLSYSIR